MLIFLAQRRCAKYPRWTLGDARNHLCPWNALEPGYVLPFLILGLAEGLFSLLNAPWQIWVWHGALNHSPKDPGRTHDITVPQMSTAVHRPSCWCCRSCQLHLAVLQACDLAGGDGNGICCFPEKIENRMKQKHLQWDLMIQTWKYLGISTREISLCVAVVELCVAVVERTRMDSARLLRQEFADSAALVFWDCLPTILSNRHRSKL